MTRVISWRDRSVAHRLSVNDGARLRSARKRQNARHNHSARQMWNSSLTFHCIAKRGPLVIYGNCKLSGVVSRRAGGARW